MINASSANSADELEWFKSSYSTSDGPECVEVASTSASIFVRDSKDKEGVHLNFRTISWSAFASFVAEAN